MCWFSFTSLVLGVGWSGWDPPGRPENGAGCFILPLDLRHREPESHRGSVVPDRSPVWSDKELVTGSTGTGQWRTLISGDNQYPCYLSKLFVPSPVVPTKTLTCFLCRPSRVTLVSRPTVPGPEIPPTSLGLGPGPRGPATEPCPRTSLSASRKRHCDSPASECRYTNCRSLVPSGSFPNHPVESPVGRSGRFEPRGSLAGSEVGVWVFVQSKGSRSGVGAVGW